MTISWHWVRWRLQRLFHRATLDGWCLLLGHRWTWSHMGAPVVGPLHVCRRCGKHERA